MRNIFIICVFLFTATLFSQGQGSIKGNITDKAMNNEPVLFANIKLKGSNTSYETNFHGNFEILDVEAGNHTLIISFAGYETKELALVVAENTITIIETELAPIQISFDDVVGMDSASKEVEKATVEVASKLK